MTLEQAMMAKLKVRQDAILEALINGVPSWEDYQKLVGEIRGMSFLMEDIQPLLRDPDDIAEGN